VPQFSLQQIYSSFISRAVVVQFEFPQLFKFKKILPSVILSDSEGFPHSGRLRGVEGPRECVLCHAVTGNSTEDLLGFLIACQPTA